jgi:ERF superfamily
MGSEISTEVQGQSANLFAVIAQAGADPNVDAGKMKAMADLAIQLQTHEQIQQFNRDFIAACAEMPVITKSGRILIPGKNGAPDRVQGTFAKFEDLNRVVKPILIGHNLSITFELADSANNRPACRPILWHRNGHVSRGELLSAPLENSGSKNDTQGVGSTTSYLKRYTMCAALNIVVESEDDDGSGGKVTMPEERGNLITEEAQAAFDDGNYQDWYKRQSPKDRGWLVTSGLHARYGGAPALSGPAATSKPAAKDPPADQPSPAEAAATWAKNYTARVGAAADLDSFAAMQTKHKDSLDKIRTSYPELWNDISFAHGAAYDRLSGNQDDSAAEPADDLFAGGSDET